jgi:hypothetical protein
MEGELTKEELELIRFRIERDLYQIRGLQNLKENEDFMEKLLKILKKLDGLIKLKDNK